LVRSASPRIDVAAIRREQITVAAATIIATRGIQNLSLSTIEEATGMSRGQLTYYFPTKEDILLAVFDHTVRRMRERMAAGEHPVCEAEGDGWKLIVSLLERLLLHPVAADFAQLQYSFLAQTGFREDFRHRLASLYDDWRTTMAASLRKTSPTIQADPQLLASFVQALLHGLVMQLQADPAAFDRPAMLQACTEILGRVLGVPSSGRIGSVAARPGDNHRAVRERRTANRSGRRNSHG
jgi:AcrR family transcriptional regulator